VGTEVIQIQRSEHILTDFSKEASEVIEEQFRAEGIQLYTKTSLKEVSHGDEGFKVTFEHDGEVIEVTAPHLLNALGRRPNTKGLGLDKAGVELKRSGHIDCDDFQQTSNPKIWASGDVAGPHEIVHIAILQGELAARKATDRRGEAVNYDTLLGVVFTDPQIGTVGLSEKQLKERGIDYLSADYPFDDHGKSILMEAKRGYVKIFADQNGVVLGAECVGKDGGELIHSIAVGVTLKASVTDLLRVHWYHPTLSEIWSYPLEDIQEEL
jgi:pyruvate/2-oxoglutarate dehydrogenase complex dihydrolipoamide dehydrogenase (E3) component